MKEQLKNEASREDQHAKIIHMDDIGPRRGNGGFRKFFTTKETVRMGSRSGNGRLPKGIMWGIIGLIVLFLGGSAIMFYSVRHKAVRAVSSHLGGIEAGAQDLQNFDLQAAAREFSSSNEGMSIDLKNAAGVFGFLLQNGGPFHFLFDISNQVTALSNELNGFEESFFGFLSTGNGGTFVSGLANIRDTLHAINAESGGISGALSFLGSSLPSGIDLLSLKTEIGNTSDFLDAFVPWLQASPPRHILVFFQNPSEIRPAGGFLGSYADVALAGGNITGVAVHDIADVDAAFAPKIVPPKPLQAEVSRWRPADANWFFDFKDSASETISFFEASALYAASSTKFDAAIAVSPKLLKDILSLTGPITVSSTHPSQGYGGQAKTVFNADTFLVQIQKIVQNGQAMGATYPKGILSELVKAMFRKMEALDDNQKQAMIPMAMNWAKSKDIMFYGKDPSFESFFENHNIAGTVAELPQNFEGDYLAIVDANIVGQKTDLYIAQNINFESQINLDGTVSDNVLIHRKHNGNQSPYWWYRAANQDYLQLFVPDGATLLNESGGIAKKIASPIAYAKNGYSTDSMVSAIETTQKDIFGYPVSSHQESGKTVFATWSRVTAGNTASVSFDYSHRLFLPPADGIAYQFIFEKQAGVARHYKFEIMAPLGFQFAENGLPTYAYESDDPPGRLIINLTLKKV